MNLLQTIRRYGRRPRLRKAVTIDDSENTLNNAAYLPGEHNVAMDLAETWSKRSIEIVEKELNSSTVSNVQSSTWVLSPGLVIIGIRWDGYIFAKEKWMKRRSISRRRGKSGMTQRSAIVSVA